MFRTSNRLLKDNLFRLTTNWIKEDEFHPTCIIGAMKGYTLPPHLAIGLTELVTYMTDGKRDSHADKQGAILGFTFNVIPRVKICEPYLKQQFPRIEEYANSLSANRLKEICHNQKFADAWIKEVEKEFGSSVKVQKISTAATNAIATNIAETTASLFDLSAPLLYSFPRRTSNKDSSKPAERDESKNHPKL